MGAPAGALPAEEGVADAGEGMHPGVGVADADGRRTSGGPAGSPVMCIIPEYACAMKSKRLVACSGPVWPKPETETMTRRALTAESDA